MSENETPHGKLNYQPTLKKSIIIIHHSIELTPIEAIKKYTEEAVYSNLPVRRGERLPEYKLGDLVRTAENKKVFSEEDTTNWNYKLDFLTQLLYDTYPKYEINHLPERYIENLLSSTKLTIFEYKQVMMKLSLHQ